jgi:Protein of unknown function (DUF2680)
MEKNTKILLIVLVCALVVALVTTTALAVALCMDNSHHDDSREIAKGNNQKAPFDNQPPIGRNDRGNNLDNAPLGGRGILGQEVEKVASVLGLSPADLLSELRGGKTLAQIAGEKGVPTQTLVDTILEPAKQLLSNRVQNGKITQEQADQRLQQLTTRIEDFINNGGTLRGLRNGQNGQQTQPSATSSSTL